MNNNYKTVNLLFTNRSSISKLFIFLKLDAMMRPTITSLRVGRVLATSQAPAMLRTFSTSSHLRTDISSSALPKQKPVGAFRGG